MSTQTEAIAAGATEAVEMTYRAAVAAAIIDEMATDPTVVLMGEDVGAGGGVFKTNEGVVERFGTDRVINTPICENGFLGVALGMAVTGLRPVVEIMFSDFLPSAGDAIVNELPKFRFMSGGQCAVPLTVRAIGGGTGRFGTQHSATGESWYLQLPGLKVAAASSPSAAYGLLRAAIRENDPVLVFEHKGLLMRKGAVVRDDSSVKQVGKANITRQGSDITVVATMLMADRVLTAAEQLSADGIDVEVVDLQWLRPLDIDTVEASVRRTGRVIVVEEQVHVAGWGAAVISQLAMRGVPFKQPPAALSLPDDLLVPYSPALEDQVIPSVDAIASAIRQASG
jgi:acetoin:2,6-dichlorophenolindophenol oxidoreductase subunit beta